MTPSQETSSRETVAVCIPTYNQAPYLAQAIASVLAQGHPVDEIIVSDDASTDETPAICEQFSRDIPFFRYYRQPHNLGMGANVEFVLRQATSTYVARLDSDDRFLPDFLGHLIAAIREAPQAGYAHGNVWELDGQGNRVRLRTLYRPPGFQAAHEALIASLPGYRVTANIVLFRGDALMKVDIMKGEGSFAGDYHLSVALARAGYGNVYVPEPLAEYRVWSDQQGVRARRKEQELRGLIRVFDEQLEPGFREAGMPLAPVRQARRSFALRHVVALDDANLSVEEKKRLESCLLELGDSPLLRLLMRLSRWRLGFLLRGYWKTVGFSRGVVKKILRGG